MIRRPSNTDNIESCTVNTPRDLRAHKRRPPTTAADAAAAAAALTALSTSAPITTR
jgi:hypothetical protein